MPERTMDRLAAALEGTYTPERELGEGGMATVYLAHDVKHDRQVALKVLKPELAAVVGAERFLAEIKTTARLQHPNILPLFDSGEADSFLYYVMPYVEGESLRERLERERQLPVDEAVRLTSDMAEALDYAHKQGVIHRDIKPANILMQQGRPVIADFGIALAVGAAGGARLTETGLSVGTPYYMSPEQATGDQHVGPPSDTYSLGCVLYEMLVGEPPFPGATAQAVLGKIISGSAVSATEQRPSIPANVDAAIRRCLEKLPADRFASAADFARALNDPSFRHGAAAAGAGAVGGAWRTVSIGLGAALVAALAFIGWSAARPVESPGVLRYMLEVPLERGSSSIFGNQIAISPDGRQIVYVGREDGDPATMLYLRDRNRLEPRALAGTEGVSQPAFSPDGARIAFITESRDLKVISLGGEPPLTLTEGIRRGGLSWAGDGYIYFAESDADGHLPGLRRIHETGGDIEVVTQVDTMRQEVRHYFPDVLPGSRLAVVTIARETNYDAETREVGIADLETGEVTVLLAGAIGHWSPSGHILVIRPDGALMAAPFDEGSREAGPAVPILEGVQLENQASADFGVSRNGTLVYAPGGIQDNSSNRVVWVDRSGNATPVDADWTGDYSAPRLSPDGRRVAVDLGTANEFQVWIKELDQGPEAKLTFQGTQNDWPAWSPNGTHVAYVSNVDGANSAYIRRADAAVPAEVLVAGSDSLPVQDVGFSPDGEWILWFSGGDVYAQRASGDGEVLAILTEEEFFEANAQISPDGRWIAFLSDESGSGQVYVRPFPNVRDGKWLISTGVGTSPRWSADGTELFYKTQAGDFMVANVRGGAGANFVVESRRALFPWADFVTNANHAQYDVHPDGDRFIMIEESSAELGGQLLVVENFFQEIEGRVRE